MKRSSKRLRVLVLCHDVIGHNMAGPGIRFSNIARVLGRHFDVTLGVFDENNRSDKKVVVVNPDMGFQSAIDKADIIFAQWLSRPMINYASQAGKVVVFDLYAPVPIEYLANLEFSKVRIDEHKKREFEAVVDMYKGYLNAGSFFTCSNERQRDFWAGFLTASGMVNIDSFRRRDFNQKFLICPMGVDTSLPKPARKMLRSKVGLGKDDFVLLWAGGIWDWFDAQMVVRAMSQLNKKSIKLVFLGTKHPNSIVYGQEMNESLQARKLAGELGLIGKTVFFLDGWIPYNERADYLVDADAAIYADKQSLETRFSHRTRVLDHFWAELPTIASKGDYMSEIIEQKTLGITVERTPQAFAEAINKLSRDAKLYQEIKSNLHRTKTEFIWEKTLEPLVAALDRLDIEKMRIAITKQAQSTQAGQKLPIKSRVKRSAKLLLLGQ